MTTLQCVTDAWNPLTSTFHSMEEKKVIAEVILILKKEICNMWFYVKKTGDQINLKRMGGIQYGDGFVKFILDHSSTVIAHKNLKSDPEKLQERIWDLIKAGADAEI